ncbi:DUF2798 domain-containing protein [Marinobacterium jannaschii]|uniref:DUF2798 domain-containing protein n=1 Tax=Marinobacterium jannaschii TaxID=64970 RepID=UPI0005649342|nr:DUF2798 domain-containing protein [Marinobacterium jannaschii]
MPIRQRLIQSALMSLVLCVLMTCWITFLNLGMSADFLARWGKAFLLAWPAAFVIAFSMGPGVMKLTQRIEKTLG